LFGAPSSRADTASATLAATSDYVFRGISQSRGDPAVQAGVTYATDAGWYVSAWGSTVRFAPEIDANAEIDLVAGWAGTVSGKWTADVNVTHFWYPGTAIDSDYTELIASLAWDDVYKATLGWSPDVFASGSHGTYLQASARWPFAQVYRIEAALGHYQLSDGYGDDYLHWQLSGVRTFAPFELRLSFHNTDSAASTLFHGVAGSRIEFAIQLSL
jgi:uncharacterized protein (TIGR02001 family)